MACLSRLHRNGTLFFLLFFLMGKCYLIINKEFIFLFDLQQHQMRFLRKTLQADEIFFHNAQ